MRYYALYIKYPIKYLLSLIVLTGISDAFEAFLLLILLTSLTVSMIDTKLKPNLGQSVPTVIFLMERMLG